MASVFMLPAALRQAALDVHRRATFCTATICIHLLPSVAYRCVQDVATYSYC